MQPYDNRIVTTHKAKYKWYFLTVKETCNNNNEPLNWLLSISGSLHKNHFNGENHSRFTFNGLHLEINALCKALLLKPGQCKIQNIEFGVNVELPYSVSEFIKKNILSFKGKPFVDYKSGRGKCIGAYCAFGQYTIKVYSKGLQFGLNCHLLRFEIKINRMQKIRLSGIKFLSDLFDAERVKHLRDLLLKFWEDILIFENGIDIAALNVSRWDKELIIAGLNKGWKETFRKGVRFTKKETERYCEKRKRFKTLMQQYGENSQGFIRNCIQHELEYLMGEGGNFTVKIKGEISPHPQVKRETKKAAFSSEYWTFFQINEGKSDCTFGRLKSNKSELKR